MTRSFLRGMVTTLLVVLAALAGLSGAQAGGWSAVVLDSASAQIVGQALEPGATVEIGFTVLQHGTKPVSGLTPAITLRPVGGGAPITVEAVGQGEAGHYTATFSLPEAGVWRWEINAFGPPSVMAPLTVAAAPAPSAPSPAPVLAVLFVAAAALVLLGFRVWSPRRSAAVPQ